MDRSQELIAKKVQKGGLRALIDGKCIECIHDPLIPGSWRKQVEECLCTDCPLFSVRPITYAAKARAKEGNLKAMARHCEANYEERLKTGAIGGWS